MAPEHFYHIRVKDNLPCERDNMGIAICLNCSWKGIWKDTVCDVGQWGIDRRCPNCKVSGMLKPSSQYKQLEHSGWKCIVNPCHISAGGLLLPHQDSNTDFIYADCICGQKNAVWSTPDNQQNICPNCKREYKRGLFIFWIEKG